MKKLSIVTSILVFAIAILTLNSCSKKNDTSAPSAVTLLSKDAKYNVSAVTFDGQDITRIYMGSSVEYNGAITGDLEIYVNKAGAAPNDIRTSILASNLFSERDLGVTQVDGSNLSIIYTKGYSSYVANGNDYQLIPQALFLGNVVTSSNSEGNPYYNFDVSALSGVYTVQTSGTGYLLTSTIGNHTVAMTLTKLIQ